MEERVRGSAGDGPTIGVDIGGTKVLGVVVGPDGIVIANDRVLTPPTGEEILDAVADLVVGLAETPAFGGARHVIRVGVGAPGNTTRRRRPTAPQST